MKNKLMWFVAGAAVSFVFKDKIAKTINDVTKTIQDQNEGEG